MSEKTAKGEFSLFPEMDPNSAILGAKEISDLVRRAGIISRETFDDRCLESTSYDIGVGNKGIIGGQGRVIDLTSEPLIIAPGSYAGVISREKVKLPKRVLAQIGSKRKLAYEGLILLTGSIVDPGYEGHLLFGLYNASTRKVVVPTTTKICSLTFVWLSTEQKPVGSDPHLLVGDFPPDFVTSMANMDVLPWAEISQEVRHIQQLARDILELRQKYEDVLQPIKELTENVSTVSSDVGKLAHELKGLGEKVGKLDEATRENARQLSEAIQGVKLLTSEVKDVKKTSDSHSGQIGDLRARAAKYSTILYIVGYILLLILGALLNNYVFNPRTPTPPSYEQQSSLPAPQSHVPSPSPPTKSIQPTPVRASDGPR